MDLLAICQGLGLAIAAGLIIGAVVPGVMPAWGAIAGAAPLGVLAAAAALSAEDESLVLALPVGLIGAGLAAAVSRDVAAGAARREQATVESVAAQPPAALIAIVVVAAMMVAGLSVVASPLSLLALAGLTWLWLSRRRRSQQKHEGLRVLR